MSVYHNEVTDALNTLKDVIDTDTCLYLWESALANTWTKENVWVHGDVAIGNLLQQNYHLAGNVV